MNPLALLADLQARGVVLTVNESRLAYDASAGTMTPDVLATIKAHKPELMAVLTGRWQDAAGLMVDAIPDAGRRADLWEWFDERAGHAEYEGLASRADAERAALEQPADAMEGGGR